MSFLPRRQNINKHMKTCSDSQILGKSNPWETTTTAIRRRWQEQPQLMRWDVKASHAHGGWNGLLKMFWQFLERLNMVTKRPSNSTPRYREIQTCMFTQKPVIKSMAAVFITPAKWKQPRVCRLIINRWYSCTMGHYSAIKEVLIHTAT